MSDYDDDETTDDQYNGENIVHRTVTIDYKHRDLTNNMLQKIISLQDQLIQHAYGGNKLNDNDVIRYSAMVDVLKAMLVKP